MFRRHIRLPITLCLALFAAIGTANPALGQTRDIRTSGSTELTTTVELDESRMAELAERSGDEKLTMFEAIRGAGTVSLSGGSSELMLVMFEVDAGKVVAVSESEPFSMRGNSTRSLDEVMYGEEKPVNPGHAGALGGWHIASAGEQGVAARDAMDEPDVLLKSRDVLSMPRGWQEMIGIVVMAVPTDRRALSTAIAQPAGLFEKEELVGDP